MHHVIEPAILYAGAPNRIDSDRWRPLIMSFRELYDLGARLRPSRLAAFPEERFAPRRAPAGTVA